MGKFDHFGLDRSTKHLYESLDRSTDRAIKAAQDVRAAKNTSPPLTPGIRHLTADETSRMDLDMRFGFMVAMIGAALAAICCAVWLWSGFAVRTTSTIWVTIIGSLLVGAITYGVLNMDGVQVLLGWVRRHKMMTFVGAAVIVAFILHHH